MKMKILIIYECIKERYQAIQYLLKNFMEKQKLVLHINKQKYYNILDILRFKCRQAKQALHRAKYFYKELHKTSSISTLIDEEELKNILDCLKSSLKDNQKLDSQNEALKAELNAINNQISKTRLLIGQFALK